MHNVGLSDIYIYIYPKHVGLSDKQCMSSCHIHWQVLGHLARLSLSRGVATKHLHSFLCKPKSLFESDKHPTKTFCSIINLRTLQTVINGYQKRFTYEY